MKRLFLLILFSLFVMGCEKEYPFNDEYEFMYGDWEPTFIEKGMTSNIDPSQVGDLLQIAEKNSYKIIKNGVTVESGHIDIISQSANKLALIFETRKIDRDYNISVRIYRLSGQELFLEKISNDSIRFYNTATDGAYYQIGLSRR